MKNREAIRDALKEDLETLLVTTHEIVKEVVGHKVTDLAGKSPIVGILSAGSERPTFTMEGNHSIFHFELQVVVAQIASGWTAAQAEDRLDLIEQRIAEYVQANRGKTNDWYMLSCSDRSIVQDAQDESGKPYLVERIPIAVEVDS